MNILKKKKSIEPPRKALVITVDDIPTNALMLTYNHYQKKYQQTKSEESQKKLVLLSKILNDRAYEQGDGHLKKEALQNIPGLTAEKYDSLSKSEKEDVQKYVEKKKELDKAFLKLTTPEPETVEIEMKVETPTTMKAESEHVTVDTEPWTEEEMKMASAAEKKEKKKGWLSKLNEPILQKDKPKPTHSTIETDRLFEKKRKPVLGFLKKKKKKQQVQIPVSDELVNTIDRIKQDEPQLFKKPVTPEQKERARKMEIATRLKLGGFRKKQEENPNKLNLKGLEEVYCFECKHDIKQHTKGGVDMGCQKCGCLMTAAQIAKDNGIDLKQPKKVVKQILKENELEEEEKPIKDEKKFQELLEENRIKDLDHVKKQAAQLATMQAKQKPKPQPQKQKTVEEEIQQMELEENQQAVDEPAPQVNQCICDHPQSEHFNGGEFCQNTDCLCERFKAYPK